MCSLFVEKNGIFVAGLPRSDREESGNRLFRLFHVNRGRKIAKQNKKKKGAKRSPCSHCEAIRRLARNGTGIRVIWRNEKKKGGEERDREEKRGKKRFNLASTPRGLARNHQAWPIEDGLKNLKQDSRQNRRCVEIKSVKLNELVNWIGSLSSLRRGVERAGCFLLTKWREKEERRGKIRRKERGNVSADIESISMLRSFKRGDHGITIVPRPRIMKISSSSLLFSICPNWYFKVVRTNRSGKSD